MEKEKIYNLMYDDKWILIKRFLGDYVIELVENMDDSTEIYSELRLKSLLYTLHDRGYDKNKIKTEIHYGVRKKEIRKKITDYLE